MDKLDAPPTDPTMISARLRGETIAYAVQHAAYNVAANLYEPYINHRRQKYYALHHPQAKFGSWSQNFAGELAGDVAGSGTLIAAELLFPSQLHSFMRKARSVVDPLYTSVAHSVFADQKCEPDYQQKIDEWKTFQERNLVRSLIMVTAGIAGNLAMQKFVAKNPSPLGVIFTGKLLSASVTTGLGLTARFAFPNHAKRIDNWMSKHIFAPMMEDKEMTSHVDAVTQPTEGTPEIKR